MLKGHDIVCFSSDWKGDPTSKHHIIKLLSQENRILWINSIGYRAPKLSSGKDLGRAWMKIRSFFKGNEIVNDNLHVLNPIAIPLFHSPAARAFNKKLLLRMIRKQTQRMGFGPKPIVWSFLPNTIDMVRALDRKMLLYYITDEFTAFSGINVESMRELETALMKESDIVFVTAQKLYNSKSPFNPNTYLMRHGVNVSHFMRSRDEKVKVNPVIGDLPGPVIGFFGRIDDWIDLELIAGVAEAHPDWSVVMIGRAATDIAILEKLKNVHFLGQVPYEELPGYCKGFNVGLVPFKRNELTESVNPLKLYEYMAAGIPVASVGLPEVMEYKDITWIGDGKESFLKAVEAALGGLDEEMIRKRDAILAELPWERKVEKISELIEKTLQS